MTPRSWLNWYNSVSYSKSTCDENLNWRTTTCVIKQTKGRQQIDTPKEMLASVLTFKQGGFMKGAKASLNVTNLTGERHAANFDSSVFAPPDDAAGGILVFHASAPRQVFGTIGFEF